jgi:hypothetical protein
MNTTYNCFIPIILNHKKLNDERNCRALGLCLEYEASQLHHSPTAAQSENTSFISHTYWDGIGGIDQCFGSELESDSIRPVDPDPRRQKMTLKDSSCFEVLDVLFLGLRASPVAWTSFMEPQV